MKGRMRQCRQGVGGEGGDVRIEGCIDRGRETKLKYWCDTNRCTHTHTHTHTYRVGQPGTTPRWDATHSLPAITLTEVERKTALTPQHSRTSTQPPDRLDSTFDTTPDNWRNGEGSEEALKGSGRRTHLSYLSSGMGRTGRPDTAPPPRLSVRHPALQGPKGEVRGWN